MGLATSKQEAFWEACGFGHINRVKRFIEEGTDVNWVSYTHNSCAIHVASQGKPEIVRMLIDANCNINAKDDRGNLALHHAAMKGHADIMQMLIDAGSEIDTQDKNGWTPLLNAAYFCQPDAVETLIKNNCDVNLQNKDERTALHEACRSQSRDENGLAIITCHLVEANADINAKSSDVGEADFTPLMFAAYHGHADVAEVLAEAGCDINAQGSNGWTALHWAIDRGHKDVAKVLLKWGIDPLIEGRRGELALDRAQDNSLKDLLAEVTSQAKNEHDINNMVSHSPVSTTSPLSSSCGSSLNSGINDIHDDNTHQLISDPVIDNDLALKLEAIAAESPASEEGGESSCTSGTISEKDEKEPLEKEQRQKCDSLSPDGSMSSELVTDTASPDTELGKHDAQITGDVSSCEKEDGADDKSKESTCPQDINVSDNTKIGGSSQVTQNGAHMEMLDSTNDDTLDQVSEINTDTKTGVTPDQGSEVNAYAISDDTPAQLSDINTDAMTGDTVGQVSDLSTDTKSGDTTNQSSDVSADTNKDDLGQVDNIDTGCGETWSQGSEGNEDKQGQMCTDISMALQNEDAPHNSSELIPNSTNNDHNDTP